MNINKINPPDGGWIWLVVCQSVDVKLVWWKKDPESPQAVHAKDHSGTISSTLISIMVWVYFRGLSPCFTHHFSK